VKWPFATLAWILLYFALLAAITGAMFWVRGTALAVYGTPEAQAEWNTWREDAKQLAEDTGPVKRRFPKSAQPPALVLMRDHFAVCLGLALVLSTVLFGTLMLLVRGAMKDATRVGRDRKS